MATNNQGFKGFHPMFFLLAKLLLFCPKNLEKKIARICVLEVELQSKFSRFLLHYNFNENPTKEMK
jgi:hypothetical protein